ncbi:hypothetical protein ACFORO_25815 [Amycolatopsis halotolerans]|uniref:Uncharacterized protein n=1 Tax=Amycolatopsis halotolerans TaxID=330083 RepID=A0ABV7QJW1_9PSEU
MTLQEALDWLARPGTTIVVCACGDRARLTFRFPPDESYPAVYEVDSRGRVVREASDNREICPHWDAAS